MEKLLHGEIKGLTLQAIKSCNLFPKKFLSTERQLSFKTLFLTPSFEFDIR